MLFLMHSGSRNGVAVWEIGAKKSAVKSTMGSSGYRSLNPVTVSIVHHLMEKKTFEKAKTDVLCFGFRFSDVSRLFPTSVSNR